MLASEYRMQLGFLRELRNLLRRHKAVIGSLAENEEAVVYFACEGAGGYEFASDEIDSDAISGRITELENYLSPSPLPSPMEGT